MRIAFALFIVAAWTAGHAQDINVEYDKKRDLSRYKSFVFGEAEVITPKDRRQIDEVKLHKWVKEAVVEQLTEKGMTQADSVGDLVVSYVIGSQERSDYSQLGPLWTSPGDPSQTWSRNYQMGSLIIDLNDKNNNLIWRVNATTSAANMGIEQLIDQVVSAGFKKFSLKPKKVKKKK